MRGSATWSRVSGISGTVKVVGDGVETVGAKIVDETGLFGHFVGLYPQVLHDDLFHPLANVTHRSNLVLFKLGRDSSSNRNHRRTASSWLTVVKRLSIAEYRLHPPSAAPAGPNFGYHTSNALTSARQRSRASPEKPSISTSYLRTIVLENHSSFFGPIR